MTKVIYLWTQGAGHRCFTSYLENGKQFVSWQESESSTSDITCGVPQGSMLRPLLLLLYINDLPNVSKLLFPILFADDSNVFLTGNDVTELINTMNAEYCMLVNWLHINKLQCN